MARKSNYSVMKCNIRDVGVMKETSGLQALCPTLFTTAKLALYAIF